MTRFVLTLVCALLALAPDLPARAPFAIAFVRETTGAAVDVTLTFGAAPSASNHIVIVAFATNDGAAISVTGWTPSITTLVASTDVGAFSVHSWCTVGDGSDTALTLDGPGGVTIRAAAIEVSGASCDSDGTSINLSADGASPYTLASQIATSQAGTLIVGMVHSTGTSNYSGDTGTTPIPATGADIPGGDDVGLSLGGFKIAGAAGNYDLPFTSAAGESTSMFAVSVKEAGGATNPPPSLLMLGVGTPKAAR